MKKDETVPVDLEFLVKMGNQLDELKEKIKVLETKNEKPTEPTTVPQPSYTITFQRDGATPDQLKILYKEFVDDFRGLLTKYPDLKRFICNITK